MVSAEARTAELASIAMQHKFLAYELRERAMELAHRGTHPEAINSKCATASSAAPEHPRRWKLRLWSRIDKRIGCRIVLCGLGLAFVGLVTVGRHTRSPGSTLRRFSPGSRTSTTP